MMNRQFAVRTLGGCLDPWDFSTSWGCWKTPPPSTTPGQLWIHGVPDSESRTFSGDKVPKLISDRPRPDGFVLQISQNDQTFVVPLLLGTPRWGMAPHFQHFGLDQVSFDLGCRRLSRLSGKALEQLSGWRGSIWMGWTLWSPYSGMGYQKNRASNQRFLETIMNCLWFGTLLARYTFFSISNLSYHIFIWRYELVEIWLCKWHLHSEWFHWRLFYSL